MRDAATADGESGALGGLIRRAVFGLAVAYASLLAVSYALGLWYVDADGQPIAADFIAFWAAGELVLRGEAASAYDWVLHKAAAVEGIGAGFDGYFSYQYPPTFLLVAAFFALVPYLPALFAWMAVGLAAYAAVIKAIAGRWSAVIAALAWPAVLWNAAVGQNGFATAALLGGGIVLLGTRPVLAGVLFGLLTYKPQFGLLIPVALIVGGHWRTLFSAAATAICLAAASAVVLGFGVWTAFLDAALSINTAILADGGTGFAKLQSLYGYARLLGAGSGTAWTIHGCFIVALGVMVAMAWRGRASFEAKAALLAAATLAASPYAFIYDYVALAVPLAFLGRNGFSRREMAAILVAGLLIGWGPSAYVPTAFLSALIVLGLAAARVTHESRKFRSMS